MDDIPVLELDPFSAAFFDDPYPGHTLVRESGPVVFLSRYGCYATGRHAEIQAMLMDWESFVSSRGVGISDYKTNPPLRGPAMLLETDPPLHTARREVMNHVLSPASVRALRGKFAAAAEALAEGLAARGECCGIRDIAEAYPLSVFPDALGMGSEGRENLLPFGSFVFNSMGPRNEMLEASLAELPKLNDWMGRQVARDALGKDGFGAAIYAAADRGAFRPEEAPLLVRALLSAGVDTTVNAIGAALAALVAHPDEWAKLRAEPGLARGAFEEAIRYESPVQTFFRTTSRRVELGGVPIPEGAKVLMFLAAANRDPRRWEEPDRFDITRNASGHVGFGAGIHMCVGQVLARMEGEAVLTALARRFARLEAAGASVRRHNNTLRGLRALPLRLVAA
jgi:4-methoxybenzoate monooxygenase (O-demethylating)